MKQPEQPLVAQRIDWLIAGSSEKTVLDSAETFLLVDCALSHNNPETGVNALGIIAKANKAFHVKFAQCNNEHYGTNIYASVRWKGFKLGEQKWWSLPSEEDSQGGAMDDCI